MLVINSYPQRKTALEDAQKLVKSAMDTGRNLTPGEVARVEEVKSAVQDFDVKAEKIAAGGPSAIDQISQTGNHNTDGTQYLDLGSKSMVQEFVTKMGANRGEKGLAATGDVTVGLPLIDSTPASMNRPANSILQLLPVVQRAPFYSVLKQTSRGDAAAVVAPGALKPTSTMGLEKVENRLRVVATLSEPIDRFVLEDNSNLQTFVATQLTGAVQSALEQEVLNGDGTGEHFTGLANTSGIQVHTATAADRLVTLFEALAKLEGVGVDPSAIVLSSADWTAIATTRNTGGSFDMGGAVDPATRRVWGTPAVLSSRLAAGSAYVLGAGAVVLGRDGAGVRTDWGTPGDTFKNNQLVARTEGRFSLDVLDPMGVVKVGLAVA